MKEYEIGKEPKHKTGYYVYAAGYAYWHRTIKAALDHMYTIYWTNQKYIWDCANDRPQSQMLVKE